MFFSVFVNPYPYLVNPPLYIQPLCSIFDMENQFKMMLKTLKFVFGFMKFIVNQSIN